MLRSIAFACAILGCSHGEPANTPQSALPSNQAPQPVQQTPTPQPETLSISDMANEVCACKDMDCAQEVQKKWAEKAEGPQGPRTEGADGG